MAGIYIHIPFCRQKCYYCDFYKTVNTSLQPNFLRALQLEMVQRKAFLGNEAVETIYFGGGTPSVLSAHEINAVLESLHSNFSIEKTAEITVEANPDDLTLAYLNALKSTDVNRLSIGIQSFQPELLKKMNRRHTARQAVEAVDNAARLGFTNISVDLIYGLPGLAVKSWKNDLQKIFELPVQHLSAYHLTYHEGTAFYTWLKKGTLKELRESQSLAQFQCLLEQADKSGFEQYEISNFAKNKLYSRHNSSYWNGTNYLGLGPSAHSFNGASRSWNVASTEAYIRGVEKQIVYSESEQLSANDKYNEYILTRIRTMWGVSAKKIRAFYGAEKANYFQNQVEKYLNAGLVIQQEGIYTLSRKGIFVSDEITASLIII